MGPRSENEHPSGYPLSGNPGLNTERAAWPRLPAALPPTVAPLQRQPAGAAPGASPAPPAATGRAPPAGGTRASWQPPAPAARTGPPPTSAPTTRETQNPPSPAGAPPAGRADERLARPHPLGLGRYPRHPSHVDPDHR